MPRCVYHSFLVFVSKLKHDEKLRSSRDSPSPESHRDFTEQPSPSIAFDADRHPQSDDDIGFGPLGLQQMSQHAQFNRSPPYEEFGPRGLSDEVQHADE